MSLLEIVFSDVWYTIGATRSNRFIEATAALLRKPRVMHWVGTDIEVARKNPSVIARLKAQHVLHLAEVDWTARELHDLGFAARIAPLPPRLMKRSLSAMPDIFTMLLYLPRTRAEFYGRAEYERLIHNLRREKIRFLIVGGGHLTTDFSAPVENLGFQPSMEEVYANSSALLRIPKRDGLSLMVLEALSLGRYVIWSQAFPFVTSVTDYSSIEAAARGFLERHLNGALPLQIEASAFVAERYDYARCLKDIATAWNDSRNCN
ncbi:MAG: glycosyltransferase family 4 protein [Candidatus Eremiobacteraeota bacterium]|nr:glycosyltransferase family 4 protein [Candidatus Eremiobacteraeota bacterium]